MRIQASQLLKYASVLLVTVTAVSCKHKTKFDELKTVSYSKDIAPVMNGNCAFSGCHGDSLSKEFKLTTYNAVMAAGIKAGDPDKSEFYERLVSLNKEKIMPRPPYDALSEKQIQLIYVWIGQGAKNN